MSQISGSIVYRLNQVSELLCFPFTDGQVDTPIKLNNALGGYVQDIIGPIGQGLQHSAASNLSASSGGNMWVGGLASDNVNISPHVGYWIKPTGSYDTWGPAKYQTITLNGSLRNPSDKYEFMGGNNLISYPFTENKDWDDAVDELDLYYNQGISHVIGATANTTAQSAKTWHAASNTFVGGLSSFMTGSGYWFKSDSGGLKTIWKAATGSNIINFGWRDCTDGDNMDRYGASCHTMRNKVTGWHQISEFPYSASAHTFGWKQSYNQTFHLISSSLGNGTSSLLDSASNSVGSWDDARGGTYQNFIVGLFPKSSSGALYPACCGATHWYSHEEFQFVNTLVWNGGNSGVLDINANWEDTNVPGLADQFGYGDTNTSLDVKVYDPRRDLVVPAAFFNVTYTDGKPVIGNSIVLSGSTQTIYFHFSGSTGVMAESRHNGVKCIKMLE